MDNFKIWLNASKMETEKKQTLLCFLTSEKELALFGRIPALILIFPPWLNISCLFSLSYFILTNFYWIPVNFFLNGSLKVTKKKGY